ncbi:phenylacetate--CoA ligase family protein [Halobacillus hunanensis]|uniref:phenylacetate--CoA ligase family protein n=1 Tax=Halobacillus hunanensis TaxID=578214 RepID=UPI0009A7AB63|nr:phenylacetate--CoA ligase family protein [Halobacillus hunanensis]
MDVIKRLKIFLMEKIRKTNGIHYYKKHKQSQWNSQQQLVSSQFTQLMGLLNHVYDHVPYYSRYMRRKGFKPNDFTSLEDLSKLPIVDKGEIKLHKKEMVTNNIETYDASEKRTGGSTGEPLTYFVPKLSHSLMWANLWRGWSVTGYQPGDKIAVLAGGSLLSGFDVKRKLYYFLNNWIPFSSYNMSENTMNSYMRKLKKGKVKFLYGYSSSTYELANFMIKKGETIQLNGVITTSEVLLPHYRTAIEKAFQCKVFDQYGANDGGVTAFECEQHQGLHIGMERCYVEIVDEEGNPVPEGVEGRILLTDLSNYAMPFIRYEVGDYGAIITKPCSCGRGLIRFTHIKGRQQEFIYAAGNRKVHGGFFSTTFRQYEAVEQFQVIQDKAGEVLIKLKLSDLDFKQRIERVRQNLVEQAELNKVYIEITDNFEKTKGGKHKFVINNVSELEGEYLK